MQTLTNYEYHGKKAKVGGPIFDENDRLRVFAAYCPNCKGKVLFDRKEAEYFAHKYQGFQNKIRTRILNYAYKQLKKYE